MTTTEPAVAKATAPTGVRRDTDRLLLRVTRRGGPWSLLLAVAALTDAVATLLLPAALAAAVDAVISMRATSGPVLAVAVLVVLSAAGEVLTELATGGTASRSTAWLRRTMVRHVLAAGPALGMRPGDLGSRLVTGTAEAGVAPSASITTITAVVPPAGAVIALILIDWRIAVALAVATPVVALVLRAFVRDTSDVVHRYLTVQGRIAGRLAGALGGHRTIASAGTAGHEERRILAELPELRADGDAMWRTQGRIGARGLVTVLFLQVSVLAVAGLELWAGRISTGALIAATQYAGLAAGLGPVISGLVRLGRARAATARAAEVLSRPAPGYGTETLPPGSGVLEFRGVTAGDHFDDLDLLVPGGLAVAVVGRSGSGKSLLAALAGRLTDPERGEVLLDGVPLPRLARHELRSAVAYAFARPAVFGTTIEDAIGFGLGKAGVGAGVGAGSDRLRAAAVAACADPFIRRLPEGYDTPVADAPMSGGELQRLGLARAFARTGRLLVLDDATSSLDTATELQVTRAVLGELSGRTRLIIAHRVATAAWADLVIWLEKGRVRGCDQHDLLWLDPDYRAVFGADDK